MPWQKIYDITPPPAGIRNLWTRAIVQNTLYLYNQGNPFILEVDATVPGIVDIIEQVDTNGFVNFAAIEGIFEGRSRLGLWDTDNSHYWGDTADVLNFTPDLRTRANTVKVDALKGNIIYVLGSTEGFITYTTANIVGATYDVSSQKIFKFFEISDNLGIFSDYSVTKADDGSHFAWTNGGLYKVENTPKGLQPFATEVADYLTSFQQAPRLSHHLNRYLAIWLHDEGLEFGRTVRQRNFVDAATYWREQFAYNPEYLKNPPVFLEALAPNAGYDFNDGLPFDCYPEVSLCPPNEQDTVLWGLACQDFPNFELEEIEIDAIEWDDGGTGAENIPLYRDPVTEEFVFAESYKRQQYVTTRASQADIALNHPGYTIQPVIRYGFDPHALLMYQAYIWQAEDNNNFNHLFSEGTMNDQQDAVVNDTYEHPVFSRSGIVNLSNTVEVDPAITRDSRRGIYETSVQDDENADQYVFTNIRAIIIETAVGSTRQTIVDGVEVRFSRTPTITIESPPDFGARDGEIISGPTVQVTNIPANEASQGILNLAEVITGDYEDDTIFATNFLKVAGIDNLSDLTVDGEYDETEFNAAFNEVSNLGTNAYEVGWKPQIWSTGSTIAATSDRCSYGNLQNFTRQRATTTAVATRTFTTTLVYVGEDPGTGDSLYIHKRSQEINLDYDVDRLHSDLLNEPGPNISRKYELNAIPLATITHPSGANPNGVLKPMFAYAETQGIDIRQAYANWGWTVTQPPSAAPFVPPTFTQAAPPTGNWYNGTDPSGTFLEYFLQGLHCSRLLPRIVWPFHLDTIDPGFDNKFANALEEFFNQPDLTGPETVFLTQTGAPGQFFPTWDRVLIWDRFLQRWGTCDVPLSLFIDLSPINEVTYDPVGDDFTTRFTYDNFLSRLGAVLESGVTTMWDDAPEDSYLVYGKIGWRRSMMTMMQEIFLEFAENPNANIILESSLDRRTLDPYNMRSEPIVRAGHTMYATISARWFNIIVRGSRYHLTGLEFQGTEESRE